MPTPRAAPSSRSPGPWSSPARTHRRRTRTIKVSASGEDLDPLEGRLREGRPALRAPGTIDGDARVASRTWNSDRPAAREPEPDVGGQAEQQHEDRPGRLLAPGQAEGATPPPGGRGKERGDGQGGQQRGRGAPQHGTDRRRVAPPSFGHRRE